jgi:hypothetical protein
LYLREQNANVKPVFLTTYHTVLFTIPLVAYSLEHNNKALHFAAFYYVARKHIRNEQLGRANRTGEGSLYP